MKIIFQIFSLVFVLLISPTSFAEYENPFSLGVVSGFGIGLGNCAAPGCTLPNIGNSRYTFIPATIVGAYRFNEANSLRFGVGIDRYVSNSPYANSAKIFVAGEAYYVYHFTNERQFFSPYALAGFRFPVANIGLGIGNEFAIGDSFSVLFEVLANTFFTLDQRFEGRFGLVKHF